jgi:hypothetical protein
MGVLKPLPRPFDKEGMSLPTRFQSRLTYANVMSSIALFVALSGGAYAISVPKDSVGSSQLQKGSVTAAKVRDRSLTASDFRRGQLPVLNGARAADLNPAPRPGKVIKSVSLRLKATGRAFVLGTVRDVFLSCGSGSCDAQWGVYVDNKPVSSTGMNLRAPPNASDGYSFYTLYGMTKQLRSGNHTVKLARTSSGSVQSVGELGAQLGALTLSG